MSTEQLSEQLGLVMERQGALENALMQERQARAEAEQRLSVALGEVGGGNCGSWSVSNSGKREFQFHDGLHRYEASGETRQV